MIGDAGPAIGIISSLELSPSEVASIHYILNYLEMKLKRLAAASRRII